MNKKSDFVSYYVDPVPSTSTVTHHFQATRKSLYQKEPTPEEIPQKPESQWEVMRIEVKKANTREEHHENVRRIVKAYARRKNLNLQFTLYDGSCPEHVKYARKESTSECQELMDTTSLTSSK
jgi:hypothetical protein